MLQLEAALDLGEHGRAGKIREVLGMVTSFALLGPFDNEGGLGFARRLGPELRAGRGRLPVSSFAGKSAPVRWRLIPAVFPDGRVRVSSLARPARNSVVYLRADLEATGARVAALRVGTSCAYRVWLNGELVASRDLRRPLRPDQDAVGVHLRAGRNALLVKLAAQASGGELLLRVTAPGGGPLAGVRPRAPRFGASRRKKVVVYSRLGKPKVGPRVTTVLQTLTDLRARRPKDAAVLADLVRHHLHTHPADSRKERARRLAELLVKLRPGAPSQRLLAQATRDGDMQRRALVAALALSPRDGLAMDGLGDFYYGADRLHLARRFWRRALGANPRLVRVRIKLAELLQLQRMPSLARMALRRLRRRYPRSDDVLRALASLEASMGRVERAVKMLTGYARRHHRDLGALTLLASLERRRLRPADASRWLRWQMRAWPDRLRPRIALARHLAANGEGSVAMGILRRAQSQVPRCFDLAEALARVALLSGSLVVARAHLRRAAALRPQSLRVKQLLAHLERRGPDPLVKRYAKDGLALARAAWKRKSKADAEVLWDLTAYRVLSSGLSRKLRQQVVKINSSKGVAMYRTYELDYLPDTQHLEVLVARVIRPDGSERESTQRDVQMANPATRMYYDRRIRTIRFPSLRPGDVIELQTVLSDTPATNMFKDYFGTLHPLQGAAPIRRLQLVVELSSDRSIRFSRPALKGFRHKVSPRGKVKVHSFEVSNVPAVQTEPQMPGWAETYANLHISTFRRWEDVARWYWGLVKGQFHADAAIKRAVAAAVRGKGSELDKVIALYHLVARKTRYVALAFGVHTYKPYPAPSVFARKFGDCKDKAMLLSVMLSVAGIKSHPVLLRTRRNGRISTRIPSLAPFDHAILYVPSLKLWLDPTATRSAARDLPYADQGVMALIIDGGAGRLVTTPVLPASANRVRRMLTVHLDARGAARVQETWIVRGQEASWWRRRFADPALRSEEYGKLISQTFLRARVTSVTISNADELERPLKITARYLVPGFARVRGRTLTFDLALDTSSRTSRFASLARRKQPLEYSYPWEIRTDVVLQAPKGYRVMAAPGSARVQGLQSRSRPRLFFEQSVVRGRGSLLLRRLLRVEGIRFSPGEYLRLRRFWLKVDRHVSPRVVLRRGGPP